MTVSRKHHSSYNNPINMKFVRLALVFLAFVVLALAAPPSRQNKPFRPIPRIHRQTEDETTTFKTYQPKYNPFRSSVLRSSLNSGIRKNATLPMRSEFRFRQASMRKELAVGRTNNSAPVEEPVTSSTDATFSWSTNPELPSAFAELESSSPSSISETSTSSFSETMSSPLPTVSFSQSYVTSKPPVSTTPKPSSSSLTSNSIPNAPVLLRPLTFLKPESLKLSSDSSFRPVSSLESIPSSTPKSSLSSLPRTNTLDPSSRIPKAIESSPNRPPSITTQTSASSASYSVSTPLRSAKSLPSPQIAGASIVPVSTNYEPRPKVSPVTSTSLVPSPPRSPKSATVQGGSTGYTNGVPTSYSFAYKVSDPAMKQDFGHSEKRVGDNTKGRYDVLLPDGRRQVVDYQVLGDRGYVADVTYQSR
ncbi:endochitinase A [Daphnia magna]|uniref:endochitinase A n=1 Tax=Daphnia magna TaxID=35525 RepID=UPI001E1BAC00|nr:endochitinase A [Daphnia magna]